MVDGTPPSEYAVGAPVHPAPAAYRYTVTLSLKYPPAFVHTSPAAFDPTALANGLCGAPGGVASRATSTPAATKKSELFVGIVMLIGSAPLPRTVVWNDSE